MKKILSTLLALIMLLSFSIPASAAGTANFKKVNSYKQGQFTDVPTEWYSDYVKEVYEYGLMMGTTSNKFSPSGNVTIAETITAAARLHKIYHSGNSDFDTNANPWYKPYVEYAQANSIINKTYSNYNLPAKRSEFADILSGAFPNDALPAVNQVDDDSIPDVKFSDSFALSVYKLYRAGILGGSDSAHSFKPSTNISRSEVSAIITRMANPSKRIKFTLIYVEPEILANIALQMLDEMQIVVDTNVQFVSTMAQMEDLYNSSSSNTALYNQLSGNCMTYCQKMIDKLQLQIDIIAKNGNYNEFADIKTKLTNAKANANTLLTTLKNAKTVRAFLENSLTPYDNYFSSLEALATAYDTFTNNLLGNNRSLMSASIPELSARVPNFDSSSDFDIPLD